MEISEWPYDNRFHEKVKQIEASDPEVEKFFFDLGSEDKQSLKNLIIEKKYRELLTNLDTYTEDKIIQYASVFLNFGTDAQLYAGTLMKKWKKQQAEVRENTGKIQKGIIENINETV